MACPRIKPNEFYVYLLFREDGITPFYVGKGGNDRWCEHEWFAYKNKTYKDKIILKMRRNGIKKVPKIKIAQNLTNDQAVFLERLMIAAIGRHPIGPLANGTDGGDGVVGISEEVLARRNAAIREANRRPEVRQKQADDSRRRMADPEFAEFIRQQVKRAYRERPELSRHRSLLTSKAWEGNDERRRKQVATNKDPLVNAKRRTAMLAAWQDPEHKKRMIESITPAVIEKNKKKNAETRKRPEVAAKYSESGRRGAAARWKKQPMNE